MSEQSKYQQVDPKKALEVAVGRVARAYGDLLRVAEKHGDDISKDDYAKARFFLDQTIAKIWEKIDVVRDVAKATSGEFSLDSVQMPELETIKINTAAGWQEYRVPKDVMKLPAPARPDWGGSTEPAAPLVPAAINPSTMDGKSLAKAIGGRLSKAAIATISRPQKSVNIDLDDGDDADAIEDGDLLSDVDFIDD